ncbi:hypothetical protein [Providencia sp. Me31A]|uniref:hypothetical protein n=1 Tax=Providencia sp. Me31A TaxID=3392637 RepID=UPI003D2B251E
MEIKLHANATTTPRVRRYLQQSNKSDRELAKELGISVSTVRRWRTRKEVDDQKSTPKTINKVLRQEQVSLIIWLRTQLILSLDELTTFVNQGIGQTISRASLDRVLKKENMLHMNVLGSRVLVGKKALAAGKQFGTLQLHYLRLNLQPEDGGQLHLLWLKEEISGYLCANIFQGISAQLVVNWLNTIKPQLPGDIQCIETKNEKIFFESVFHEHLLQLWCQQQKIDLRYIDTTPNLPIRLDIPLLKIFPAMVNHSIIDFLACIIQNYNERWPQKKLGGLTPYQFWHTNKNR